jgi:hypothetical protein
MKSKIVVVNLDGYCTPLLAPTLGMNDIKPPILGYEKHSVQKHLNAITNEYESENYELHNITPIMAGNLFISGITNQISSGTSNQLQTVFSGGIGAGYSYTSGYTLHFKKP